MNLPEDLGDQKTLEARFQESFGRPWSEVMAKAGLPFAFHRHWNAYLAVSGLEPRANLPLPALLKDLIDRGIKAYHVLIG